MLKKPVGTSPQNPWTQNAVPTGSTGIVAFSVTVPPECSIGAALKPEPAWIPIRICPHFDEIGGLKPRAPVVIAGVKIGQVTLIKLDDDLRARVTLDVDPEVEIPADSSAAIRTSGVLGDQYVAIEPGADMRRIAEGETLTYTQGAISLEGLIGNFMTSDDEEDEE